MPQINELRRTLFFITQTASYGAGNYYTTVATNAALSITRTAATLNRAVVNAQTVALAFTLIGDAPLPVAIERMRHLQACQRLLPQY